jgi:hypothetical protein
MTERTTVATLVKKEFSRKEFFEFYFQLRNLQIPKNQKLTTREIQLAAIICTKPKNYVLDTKKSQDGRSKKYQLSEDLGVTATGIYKILQTLEDKGILRRDEDDFIDVHPAIKNIKNTVDNPVTVNYTIRMNIDDNN